MNGIASSRIPQELKDRPQWIVWKDVTREGKPTKLPFQTDGNSAKSNDASTWTTFDAAMRRYEQGGFSGVGYVFSADDEFCGIDLDGCRDPKTGAVAEWAREVIKSLDSYGEVSPSETGVKVFVRAKSPFETGKKIAVKATKVSDKEPAIELYDKLRYFAVTGWRLAGVPSSIEPRQQQVDEIAGTFFKSPESSQQRTHFDSDDAVMERARKYLAKLPVSVSGHGGHNAAFHAACVLILGFGLDRGQALQLMAEWNHGCQPAWSQRELEHKVDQASKQPGERNYLRNTQQEQWHRVRVPSYQCPPPKRELRITTLHDAARHYLESVQAGKAKLLETGLPDIDYAVGGGLEYGEMVLLAARPSHGKSAVALQVIHAVTAQGIPSLLISEEMSELALGKRAIQFATDIPAEHWRTSSHDVLRHIDDHFQERANCIVVESCGTAERAVETIRESVEKQAIRFAVVDYAQLLSGSGRGRYEQVTNTSILLRQVATECKIVLLVLCQLSRAIETRQTFMPVMGDLKDSGQLEQDADVIVFLCWPHRIDQKKDPHEYMFFIGKNRNRPINSSAVKCRFEPSRQMFIDERVICEDPFEPARGPIAWTPEF